MTSPSRCFQCKGTDFSTCTKARRLVLGELIFEAELDAYQCDTCGQILFSDEVVSFFEDEVSRWIAERGFVSSKSFRFMRKSLGLKARELAAWLKVTPETLSRWEKGTREPDPRAVIVLGTMVLENLEGREDTMNRLKATENLSPNPDIVHLNLSAS